jgi:hypothetical protein
MNEQTKDKLKGTLIVPVGLAIVLLPFSLLVGWTLISLILFWLFLTPAITVCLPLLFSERQLLFFKSLIGLAVFYAIMVFMIYDHYESDYFQIMIASWVINSFLVSVVLWSISPKTQVQ